jgi:hypothetical protein
MPGVSDLDFKPSSVSLFWSHAKGWELLVHSCKSYCIEFTVFFDR